MPTIEESAAAYRAGKEAFHLPADDPRCGLMIGELPEYRLSPSDFMDGFYSAQREAEIERHIDEQEGQTSADSA